MGKKTKAILGSCIIISILMFVIATIDINNSFDLRINELNARISFYENKKNQLTGAVTSIKSTQEEILLAMQDYGLDEVEKNIENIDNLDAELEQIRRQEEINAKTKIENINAKQQLIKTAQKQAATVDISKKISQPKITSAS